MSRLLSALLVTFAAAIMVIIAAPVLGLSLLYIVIYLVVGIPLGYVCARLHARYQKKQSEDFADRVVKELLRTSREEQADMPHVAVSPETVMAQVKIEQRLRASEPVIVRSKLRFIARPTSEDILSAVQDDAIIIVRVPVPERWREKLAVPKIHYKLIGRCNAVLQELDLAGGHPRVMLLADTCGSKAQFTKKVYERFGA